MRSVFSSAAKRTTSRSRIAQHTSASGSRENETKVSKITIKEKNVITTDKFKVPGRVINLDQARVQHGEKADHMVRMLAGCDPPAAPGIVHLDPPGAGGRGSLHCRPARRFSRSTRRPPPPAPWFHPLAY